MGLTEWSSLPPLQERLLPGRAKLRFIPAGGFTEAGDAQLTDQELMGQRRHKSPKVLGKYVKRTRRQVAEGLQKRHAERTKSGQDSGMSNSTDSGMDD